MFKRLFRDPVLWVLFSVALLLKLFSFSSTAVERYYTYGVYPVFAKTLRFLFGWVPFSIGDIIYAAAFLYLCFLIWKGMVLFRRHRLKKELVFRVVKKILRIALVVYVVFNLFWGLNYNRQGVAEQLGLNVQTYSNTELAHLTEVLQQRLNHCAAKTDSLQRERLDRNKILFTEAIRTYAIAQRHYPYLSYSVPSLKPSLYSHIGHYFGFTGYYNPFSGEAQVKTTVPVFLKPFVVLHEIAHQLGYAKENEANLVSFLTGRQADNHEVRYSVYFEMYLYALSELRRKDSAAANGIEAKARRQIRKDVQAYRQYLVRSRNYIEPYVSLFYDSYLKWNSQPKGKMTYNEVVAWLIAYMKKYGAGEV